jgi:hypothetical protein
MVMTLLQRLGSSPEIFQKVVLRVAQPIALGGIIVSYFFFVNHPILGISMVCGLFLWLIWAWKSHYYRDKSKASQVLPRTHYPQINVEETLDRVSDKEKNEIIDNNEDMSNGEDEESSGCNDSTGSSLEDNDVMGIFEALNNGKDESKDYKVGITYPEKTKMESSYIPLMYPNKSHSYDSNDDYESLLRDVEVISLAEKDVTVTGKDKLTTDFNNKVHEERVERHPSYPIDAHINKPIAYGNDHSYSDSDEGYLNLINAPDMDMGSEMGMGITVEGNINNQNMHNDEVKYRMHSSNASELSILDDFVCLLNSDDSIPEHNGDSNNADRSKLQSLSESESVTDDRMFENLDMDMMLSSDSISLEDPDSSLLTSGISFDFSSSLSST